MDRHKDIEDPDHERAASGAAQAARASSAWWCTSWRCPRALKAYLEGLEAKRVNARVHLRKILALAELHGKEAVARALDDGLELQAFSAEYIANILAARRRIAPSPPPCSSPAEPTCSSWRSPSPTCPSTTATQETPDGNTP